MRKRINCDEAIEMKTRHSGGAVLFSSVLLLAAGCVERRVTYVPVYRTQPVYQAQPQYPAQTLYQPQPGPGQPAPANGPAVADAPSATNAAPAAGPPPSSPNGSVIVTQAPPPAQVEVIPEAPGPDYSWAPGYWSWQGSWIWIRGGWVTRPWHGALWVNGGWGRRGGRWVWRGGHWR